MVVDKTATWPIERYQRLVLDLIDKQPDLAVSLVLDQDDEAPPPVQLGKKRSEHGEDAGQRARAGRKRMRSKEKDAGASEAASPSSMAAAGTAENLATGSTAGQSTSSAPRPPTVHVTSEVITKAVSTCDLTATGRERLAAVLTMANKFEWDGKSMGNFRNFIMVKQKTFTQIPGGYRDSRWGSRTALSASLRHLYAQYSEVMRRFAPLLVARMEVAMKVGQ